MQISAAILAGGKNSRMNGHNKAFVKIGNENILQLQLNVLKKFFKNVFIVSNDDFESHKLQATKDIYKSAGPLAGIHAALEFAKSDYIFVFSCDMPFLSESLIKDMIDDVFSNPSEALIPIHNNGIEPLHGIYSRKLLPNIISLLDNKVYKIRLMFENINIRYYKVEDTLYPNRTFFNVNSINDLKKAQDYAKGINLY